MTARPPIGVLALQGDVSEHVRALAAVGADPRRVRRPDDLAGLAGLVLPGGESTTIDKLSRIFDLREPLRAAIRDGLPVYGSCAGMIMLADRLSNPAAGQQTFGGIDMVVERNAFGRQSESFETELDCEWLGAPPLPVAFIRAPAVQSCGPDVEVLGTVTDQDGAERIIAVRQANLLATAFHAELGRDHRVHAAFLDLARA